MKFLNMILLTFACLSASLSYSMEQQSLPSNSQKIYTILNNNKAAAIVVGGALVGAAGYGIYRTWVKQPEQEKFITVLNASGQPFKIEVQPPSERLRACVVQAFKDYQLNLKDYKIYSLARNYDVCAFSNSRDKRSVYNENKLRDDDSLTYVVYHESAHLKLDHSNSTKDTGTQEMEADTLACKTLIGKNNIRPICRQLLMLKINERIKQKQYPNDQGGHNASDEYKNIEQLLTSYKYSIATTNKQLAADTEEIIATVTGNNSAETCSLKLYFR